MGREFFDHTGDVGVRLTGGTPGDLFEEAALAFTDTVTDLERVAQVVAERVELQASSLDDLLVDWLGELLYRFEVQNLLVAAAAVAVANVDGGFTLTGEVRGERFDASRHDVKVLVKGVTYHQLDVRRDADGWETSIVFDI